jgi:hypothetical protein
VGHWVIPKEGRRSALRGTCPAVRAFSLPDGECDFRIIPRPGTTFPHFSQHLDTFHYIAKHLATLMPTDIEK